MLCAACVFCQPTTRRLPARAVPTLQEMLDPTIGEGVVAAMRKEVHRMELRHAELQRVQERLMQVCVREQRLPRGRRAYFKLVRLGCVVHQASGC